jgi:hypothetical protein
MGIVQAGERIYNSKMRISEKATTDLTDYYDS